jgi:hypothetical protein
MPPSAIDRDSLSIVASFLPLGQRERLRRVCRGWAGGGNSWLVKQWWDKMLVRWECRIPRDPVTLQTYWPDDYPPRMMFSCSLAGVLELIDCMDVGGRFVDVRHSPIQEAVWVCIEDDTLRRGKRWPLRWSMYRGAPHIMDTFESNVWYIPSTRKLLGYRSHLHVPVASKNWSWEVDWANRVQPPPYRADAHASRKRRVRRRPRPTLAPFQRK